MNTQTTTRLYLFGLPRVELAGESLDRFPTKRCAHILVRLSMAHQKRMSRSHLAEVLWPDEIYDITRHRLRQELTRLRKSLGSAEGILDTSGDSIRLDSSLYETDVDEFERLIRVARQTTNPEQLCSILRKSVDIAAEPFMSGSTEDWIEVERMRLNVSRYGAWVDLGNLFIKLADPAEALLCARNAMEIVPDRESAHLLAIQALCELGHFDNATAQFESLRRTVFKQRGGRLSANAERIGAQISLPDTSPPEKPMGLRPSAPTPAEPLFGRDEELAAIVARLTSTPDNIRLVTVLGMGGIGKTHLILYACRELANSYPGRVAFVDLSNMEDANAIPSAVLRALGLGYFPTKDPSAYLQLVLSSAPILLALDNLEQFGPNAAPVIRRLLDDIPTLRILAGSRTALNIGGESRLILSPLSLPNESADESEGNASAAMRLFLYLMASGHSSANFQAEEWPILSNIVRRVEGIPLALQLAASRMRILGSAALLRDLDDGREVLVNRREDAPGRHRTMRDAVETSVEVLAFELRDHLASLAIFRGGWSIDAARRVCEIENPIETMERLADASLITISNDGFRVRFKMLETIRQHSLSLLTESQSFNLRKRLVSWMVEESRLVATDIVDRPSLKKINELEYEGHNLREALRFSLEEFPEFAFELGANLGSSWLFRTSGFEACQFYSELFRRYSHLQTSVFGLRASYGHSVIAHFVQLQDNSEIYERTLEIGRLSGDRSLEVKTLVLQAFQAQNEIRYADCRAILSSIDEFTALYGSFESDGFVNRIKGRYAMYQGELETSIGWLRESVSWFGERGELFFQALCRRDLATAAIELGDVDLAEANLEGLLDWAHEIRYDMLIPAIHRCLGLVALGKRRYEDALIYLRTSLAQRTALGGKFHMADQFDAIGRTYFQMGDLAEARAAFVKASEIWLADGLPVASAITLTGLAAVCMSEGDVDRAARLFDTATREIRMAGANLTRFHAQLASKVEADLNVHRPDRQWGTGSLTLEEATRLGALPTS